MAQNNDFVFEIGTKLNTFEAEKALVDFKKKNQTTVEIKVNGKEAIKTTTTYVNKLGDEIKTIKQLSKDGGLIKPETITSLKQSNNNLKNLASNTEKFVTNLGELKTYITNINEDGKKTYTHITRYINTQGQLIEHTKELSANNKTLNESFRVVTDEEQSNTNALNQNAQATENVSKSQATAEISTKKLGQTFLDCVGKVTKFYLATKPIQIFNQLITDAKDAVLEFDKAMTEFSKVSDLSGVEMDAYNSRLNALGREVGRTGTNMLEASTSYKKSGYSDYDSAELAKISALFQNIADEEYSASEASEVLISQMKAFGNDSMEFATRVVDTIYLNIGGV